MAQPLGYRLYLDGDQWCAVANNFVNLAEFEAGFGSTPLEALASLLERQSHLILFGIWNVGGQCWVRADSGNDFKSAYEIANEAMENMIQDGSAREGLDLREYVLEAIA